MPKLKHLDIEKYVCFITTCTHKRAKVFSDSRYAQLVMDTILFGKEHGWYKLLSFVIMPDHIHLVIVPENKKVPAIMQGIKGFTSKKINDIKNAKGKLWQDGYHDFAMDNPKAIYQKLRYIEENPVRAGLANKAFDYPYSSAGKYDDLDLSYLF